MKRLFMALVVLSFAGFTLWGCSKSVVKQTPTSEPLAVQKEAAAKKGVVAKPGESSDLPKYVTAGETGSEGHFIAYGNGTVLDTITNLMWAARDNGANINWQSAKTYCENYRGGGYMDWRMPTQDELATLYNEAKNYTSDCGYSVGLTKLIHLTCAWIWASEKRGSDAANFDFYTGRKNWSYRSIYYDNRVLPVRTGK